MKHAYRILFKTIVLPFYQRNAGLFLFLFVVLFGVAQNPKTYHLQLMTGILISPVTLLLAMFAWLLYGLKVAAFNMATIQAPNHAFLKELQATSPQRLYPLLLTVQALLLAPIGVYALITILLGLSIGAFQSCLLIVLFMGLLLLGTTWLSRRTLFGQLIGWSMPVLPTKIPKHFSLLLLWHSVYGGKLKLVGVKLCSFVLLFIPLVWNADHCELSDFVFFFQLSIAAHALIGFDYMHFLEDSFPSLRNLPIPLYRIFLWYLLAYAVLFLPEAIIYFYYVPKVGMPVQPLWLLVYSIGQLLFFSALSYEKQTNSSQYAMETSMVCVCSLLVLPFAPFAVLGTLFASIGFLLFRSLYYRYEPEYVDEKSS